MNKLPYRDEQKGARRLNHHQRWREAIDIMKRCIYISIIYISAPILPFSWEPLVAYIMPGNRGIPIRQDSVPVQYLLSTPSVPLSSLVDLECLSVSGRRVDAWQYYVHC